MSWSKEDIERKRLAALQKRQEKVSNLKYVQNNYNRTTSPTNFSPIKSSNTSSQCSKSQLGFHPYAKPSSQNMPIENVSMPITKTVTGTIYLISEDRFEVNPSEFCTPLINIFKTIPSKVYDSSTKLWNFLIRDYEEFMKRVLELFPHVTLTALPQFVLKTLQENTIDPNTVDLSPIEETLRNKLLPFQEDGVRFAIARGGCCIIADDMGLGKTYQALAVASYYRHNWPLLIVTTSTMREIWQIKIHELLPSIPMMNIITLSSSKDSKLVADKQTEVVIVSYKITSIHKELLGKKKFGVIIIDESHQLKSGKAQCTLALRRLARPAARRLLLSGTPALSRPAELYTQLSLVAPRLLPSYTDYGKRYCAGRQTSYGWDMTGQSNLTELQIILHKRFLIRRTKEQVLTELEKKTRETVLLDQTLLHFTKEDQEGLTQMAKAYHGSCSTDRHTALINFFAKSAEVKIPAICKYIKQLIRGEEGSCKFLVFAHHRNMIAAICNTLDETHTDYICIVGSTPMNARAALVERFQHEARCRGAVLSLTAAGAGLTLTAADLVLFAELHWNPGVLTQAESRAHRLGRAGAVRARYLLARGTADDLVWTLLQTKLQVLNNVGLSQDSFENTPVSHQESQNNITQYLSPIRYRNSNDYIPGTNIRKNSLPMSSQYSEVKSQETQPETQTDTQTNAVDLLMDDDTDDELLAAVVEADQNIEPGHASDEDNQLLANFDLDLCNVMAHAFSAEERE